MIRLRVAIITGAGERFFSAGWDLKAGGEGKAPNFFVAVVLQV